MYVIPNFKTKKELKQAIESGRNVEVYAPGIGDVPNNGKVYLEGPHYPQPHKWYAVGIMQDGKLVKVS